MSSGYLMDGNSVGRLARLLLDYEHGLLSNRGSGDPDFEGSTSPLVHPVRVVSGPVGGLYAGKLLQYDPIENVYTDFTDIKIRDVNDSPLLAKRYLGRLAGLNSYEDVVYLVQLIGEVASGSGVSGSGESGSGSGSGVSGSVAGSVSGSVVASGPCTGTCYWMWVGTGWALTSSDCSDGCGPCVSPGSAGIYFGQLETTSCAGESGSVPDSGFSGSTAESGSASGISGSIVSGSGISGSVVSGSGSGISGSVVSGSELSGSIASGSGSGISGSIVSGSGSGISGSVSGSGISGSVSGSVAGSGSGGGSGSGAQSGGLTIEVVTDVQCVNGSIVVTKRTITIPGGS
jgi:hypothetical protein